MLKSLVANNFLNIYIFMNSDEIIAALKKNGCCIKLQGNQLVMCAS
jgi:hypothetical protein